MNLDIRYMQCAARLRAAMRCDAPRRRAAMHRSHACNKCIARARVHMLLPIGGGGAFRGRFYGKPAQQRCASVDTAAAVVAVVVVAVVVVVARQPARQAGSQPASRSSR